MELNSQRQKETKYLGNSIALGYRLWSARRCLYGSKKLLQLGFKASGAG